MKGSECATAEVTVDMLFLVYSLLDRHFVLLWYLTHAQIGF